MIIGIDPLVDFAAKRLLGSPEHQRITLHFLNSVLRFKSPIVDVTIINPINVKHFKADKESILDIKAIDRVGRRYNIEVQTTRPLALPKRLAYYAAKQLVDQLLEGQPYSDLNPSICICLLDAIAFPREPMLQHDFQFRTNSSLLLTDCVQIHLFELPKYLAPCDNQPIIDPFDQWLYFFRHAGVSTSEQLASRLPDPVFAEATGVLEMIAKTPEERQIYDDRIKAERDAQAKYDFALQQGWKQGRQEGRQEGIQEGIQEGRLRTVKILRDITGDLQPTDQELLGCSLEELAAIEADLQRRLRARP